MTAAVIGSGIMYAASAIGTAAATVGSAAATAATAVGTAASTVGSAAAATGSAIGSAASTVGSATGISSAASSVGSWAAANSSGLIVTGLGLSATGSIYSGISSYQTGKASQKAYNEAAESALISSQIQADAAMTSAEAESAEYKRKARIEEQQAGIEQIQGEQEAEKRSRQLAASVGSLYANYAGNGLLVDGRSTDTLGSALRTEVGEGQADISTINDNTAMNVWTRQSNAASYWTSAANAMTTGYNSKVSYLYSGIADYESNIAQGKLAYKNGRNQMYGSFLTGAGSLFMGASKIA